MSGNGAARVLCVDDNVVITEALAAAFSASREFRWLGALSDANTLLATCLADPPDLVLLDVDMPGRDPFEVLAELAEARPEVRVLLFSGLVRRDLVHRALEAGAWGYVSKNDGADALLDAMRRVTAGELGFSPEAERWAEE